jgi:hypothetical protein
VSLARTLIVTGSFWSVAAVSETATAMLTHDCADYYRAPFHEEAKK